MHLGLGLTYQGAMQGMTGWLTFRHYCCGDMQDPSQQAVHMLHQLVEHLHLHEHNLGAQIIMADSSSSYCNYLQLLHI